mgnify:CR=1 FL=1
MDYLQLPVRQDWQAFKESERAAARQRLLRIWILVSICAAGVLLTQFFPLHPGVKAGLQAAVSSVVFLAAVTVPAGALAEKQRLQFAPAYLAFLLPAALAAALRPNEILAAGRSLPGLLMPGLIPLLSTAILFFFWRRRSLALPLWADRRHSPWLVYVLTGLFAGAGIAFHLAYIFQSLGLIITLPLSAGPVIWAFCTQLGLAALGEELFFRGRVFHLLHEELRAPLWAAALQIIILTLLLDAASLAAGSGLLSATGALVWLYRGGLSLLNTFLVQRTGSLLPGLTTNVIFSTILWSAIL